MIYRHLFLCLVDYINYFSHYIMLEVYRALYCGRLVRSGHIWFNERLSQPFPRTGSVRLSKTVRQLGAYEWKGKLCVDRGPVTLDYCTGAYHLTSRAIDPLISMPFAVPSYKLGGRTCAVVEDA